LTAGKYLPVTAELKLCYLADTLTKLPINFEKQTFHRPETSRPQNFD